MPATSHLLTVEEFRLRYAKAKPYYEFWFGEARQKAVPTSLHGVLQFLLMLFLDRAGYFVGSEIELRIDPDWQPKPDLVASVVPLQQPYPTRPLDIVAEVLSPDDRMVEVFEKCRQYQRIGITRIFVFDPESQTAWEWSLELANLERISDLKLPNGGVIKTQQIWDELDSRKQITQSQRT